MKHSLFWAAVEAAAKATRSGLSVVGALVDCGIPRKHAGAQWLTEFEEENEVLEVPLSADFNDECCSLPDCGWCYDQSPVAMQAAADGVRREDKAWSEGWKRGWESATEAYAVGHYSKTPQDSRTNAGATCNRAVEETSEGASPPAAPSDVLGDSWVAIAIPVIAGVLAEHVPSSDDVGVVYCDGTDGLIHAEFADWQDWRAHVSPHIADRLETVTLALPEK